MLGFGAVCRRARVGGAGRETLHFKVWGGVQGWLHHGSEAACLSLMQQQSEKPSRFASAPDGFSVFEFHGALYIEAGCSKLGVFDFWSSGYKNGSWFRTIRLRCCPCLPQYPRIGCSGSTSVASHKKQSVTAPCLG